jgi:hypothetical protein
MEVLLLSLLYVIAEALLEALLEIVGRSGLCINLTSNGELIRRFAQI